MKNKAFLVSFMALFAVVFAISIVSADACSSQQGTFVTINDVEINGLSSNEVSIFGAGISETIPIQIEFTAIASANDVRVKVYIEDGLKNEIILTTDRFRIVEGSSYVKRFSVELPSTYDFDEDEISEKSLDLKVRIVADDEDDVETICAISLEKGQDSLNIMSVDVPQEMSAGDVVAVDVVVENNGASRQDNIYIRASIPELGIEKKVYLGDLDSIQDAEDDSINDADHTKIYLTIPRSAEAGIYELRVEAYNYDSKDSVTKNVVIRGTETGVIPTMTSKNVNIGQEATFEVVLINPNDRLIVYSITPQEATGLIVTVDEPIVTVGADSSRTVQVKVKATESAQEGTHIVTLNVNSESGLVRQIDLTVNVEKSSAVGGNAGNAVVVLTVVLAIIFVVLLIVLIVLLTKKPVETEEFGETSYY